MYQVKQSFAPIISMFSASNLEERIMVKKLHMIACMWARRAPTFKNSWEGWLHGVAWGSKTHWKFCQTLPIENVYHQGSKLTKHEGEQAQQDGSHVEQGGCAALYRHGWFNIPTKNLLSRPWTLRTGFIKGSLAQKLPIYEHYLSKVTAQ